MKKENVFVFLIAFCVIAALFLYGCPKYKVWQQGLAGQAELAKAEQNRKIAVQEAEAKLTIWRLCVERTSGVWRFLLG